MWNNLQSWHMKYINASSPIILFTVCYFMNEEILRFANLIRFKVFNFALAWKKISVIAKDRAVRM